MLAYVINGPDPHTAAFERLLTLNHAGVPVSVWPGSFVQSAIPLPNAARSNCATSSLWAAFGDCPQSQRSGALDFGLGFRSLDDR